MPEEGNVVEGKHLFHGRIAVCKGRDMNVSVDIDDLEFLDEGDVKVVVEQFETCLETGIEALSCAVLSDEWIDAVFFKSCNRVVLTWE